MATCLPAPDVKEAGGTATGIATKMGCLPDALKAIYSISTRKSISEYGNDICKFSNKNS
jgi:hypothetical protein